MRGSVWVRLTDAATARLESCGLSHDGVWCPAPDKRGWVCVETGCEILLRIDRDLTLADLEGAAELFGTRDVTFVGCEQGWYGDHSSAQLRVRTAPEAVSALCEDEEVSWMTAARKGLCARPKGYAQTAEKEGRALGTILHDEKTT